MTGTKTTNTTVPTQPLQPSTTKTITNDLQQPNGEQGNFGELLTKDINLEELSVINKDNKTKFVMYRNDTRVYLKLEYQIEKLKFTNHKVNQFQLMMKKDTVLDELKNNISLKLGGLDVDFYSDPKYDFVWPFVKTYKNSENQTCVLANLDGTEQLVVIDSMNGKTMGITPILRVGAIKYHNVRQKWCIGLTVEEMKLDSKVCEIVKSPPKLKFAGFL